MSELVNTPAVWDCSALIGRRYGRDSMRAPRAEARNKMRESVHKAPPAARQDSRHVALMEEDGARPSGSAASIPVPKTSP